MADSERLWLRLKRARATPMGSSPKSIEDSPSLVLRRGRKVATLEAAFVVLVADVRTGRDGHRFMTDGRWPPYAFLAWSDTLVLKVVTIVAARPYRAALIV